MSERSDLTNAEIALYLDFYGELLPEMTRKVLHMTREEDLSLSEIATELGITRQAVHTRRQKGEEELKNIEDSLHIVEQWKSVTGNLEVLKHLIQSGKINEAEILITEIQDQLNR